MASPVNNSFPKSPSSRSAATNMQTTPRRTGFGNRFAPISTGMCVNILTPEQIAQAEAARIAKKQAQMKISTPVVFHNPTSGSGPTHVNPAVLASTTSTANAFTLTLSGTATSSGGGGVHYPISPVQAKWLENQQKIQVKKKTDQAPPTDTDQKSAAAAMPATATSISATPAATTATAVPNETPLFVSFPGASQARLQLVVTPEQRAQFPIPCPYTENGRRGTIFSAFASKMLEYDPKCKDVAYAKELLEFTKTSIDQSFVQHQNGNILEGKVLLEKFASRYPANSKKFMALETVIKWADQLSILIALPFPSAFPKGDYSEMIYINFAVEVCALDIENMQSKDTINLLGNLHIYLFHVNPDSDATTKELMEKFNIYLQNPTYNKMLQQAIEDANFIRSLQLSNAQAAPSVVALTGSLIQDSSNATAAASTQKQADM